MYSRTLVLPGSVATYCFNWSSCAVALPPPTVLPATSVRLDAGVVRALEERNRAVGDRQGELITFHARLRDGHRAADNIELAGFESRQHARPRQVDGTHLYTEVLRELGEEILVEALLLSVFQKVERCELHLGSDHQFTGLLHLANWSSACAVTAVATS